MEKEEFNVLFKDINEKNNLISSFAANALKDLNYLEKNGILDQFNKLQRPSQRQIFIETNKAFKSFFDNYGMMGLSLGQSLDSSSKLLKSSIGFDTNENENSKPE